MNESLLTRLLEWFLSLFAKPTPPPGPTPPVPTPATRRITKDDNFRTLPTITLARMKEITKGFPFEAETEAIFNATGGRALPLAQSWLESRYGQDPNAQKTKNPLGLMDYSGKHPVVMINGNLPLRKFNTWAEAFAEWCRRMDDLNYPGGGG